MRVCVSLPAFAGGTFSSPVSGLFMRTQGRESHFCIVLWKILLGKWNFSKNTRSFLKAGRKASDCYPGFLEAAEITPYSAGLFYPAWPGPCAWHIPHVVLPICATTRKPKVWLCPPAQPVQRKDLALEERPAGACICPRFLLQNSIFSEKEEFLLQACKGNG